MRRQFKETILDLASNDETIVLLFGDVSVYLFKEFQERYPKRFYNMGICENSLVSVAGGLSSQGFTPFVHTIAPFLTERCLEQIKLDLCYNRFPANIVTCGATFDYAWDGATHHCHNDLAILRLLPGMEVLQPGSCRELDQLLRQRYKSGNPTYYRLSDHPHAINLPVTFLRQRYKSGNPTYYRLSDHPHAIDLPVTFGKGVLIRDAAAPVTVATAGPLLGNVMEAVSDLPVNLIYFHTIKPIDRELVARFARTDILVVQDAHGLQEAITEVPGLRTSRHGLADAFCDCYGTLGDIRSRLGLDPQGIRAAVTSSLERHNND